MRRVAKPVHPVRADGRRPVISPMTQADIEPLASLYRKVWLQRSVYRRALDPGEPRNFERAGGMFIIQDEKGLARLLADPSEYVWVAREEGRLLGALWCGLADEKYDDPSRILPHAGCENLPECIRRGLRDGVVYFSKEILVSPGERGLSLPEAMLETAMRFFYARGFRQSYGEVYHVHALRDGEGERPVDLFNNASFRMLTRTGCQAVGEFAPCTVHADGFDAVLSMRIVRWDLASSLKTTREALTAKFLWAETYA